MGIFKQTEDSPVPSSKRQPELSVVDGFRGLEISEGNQKGIQLGYGVMTGQSRRTIEDKDKLRIFLLDQA